MLQTLRNAWKVVDIRKKIIYTLLIIVMYRMGGYIPVPFFDSSAIRAMIRGSKNIFS